MIIIGGRHVGASVTVVWVGWLFGSSAHLNGLVKKSPFLPQLPKAMNQPPTHAARAGADSQYVKDQEMKASSGLRASCWLEGTRPDIQKIHGNFIFQP